MVVLENMIEDPGTVKNSDVYAVLFGELIFNRRTLLVGDRLIGNEKGLPIPTIRLCDLRNVRLHFRSPRLLSTYGECPPFFGSFLSNGGIPCQCERLRHGIG